MKVISILCFTILFPLFVYSNNGDSVYTYLKNYNYKRIDSLVLNESVKDNISIESNVAYIKKHSKNEQEIVRFIYMWMVKNIRYNGSLKLRNCKPEMVFKNKFGVCEGYANLFKLFCDKLNIECDKVIGLAKNDIAQLHAWNAVKIGDSWYIIESTWAKSGIEFYFLANPEHIIYTHFPTWGRAFRYNEIGRKIETKVELKVLIYEDAKELSKYQLLKKPITEEYFLSLDRYYPSHFQIENHLNKNIEGVYKYNDVDKNNFYKLNVMYVYNSITNATSYKKTNRIPLKDIYLK